MIEVTLIDHMGSDLSVVNAARVSFYKESQWDIVGWTEELDEDSRSFSMYPVEKLKDSDVRLIKYLAKHNHWTPFGHAFASFRIKAPLFVARQLGKHQVGLVWNEVSRRYVADAPEFYTPETWRARAAEVKQGSSEEESSWDGLFVTTTQNWVSVDEFMNDAVRLYETMIAEGVCPEQARMVLPQSMMTTWVWSGSIAAFARVCNLRLDSHTQKETRDVAQMISDHVSPLFPVSWAALQLNPEDEALTCTP